MTLFFDRGRRSSGSADRPNSTFRPNWRGVNQRAPYKPLAQRERNEHFYASKGNFHEKKHRGSSPTVPEGFWSSRGFVSQREWWRRRRGSGGEGDGGVGGDGNGSRGEGGGGEGAEVGGGAGGGTAAARAQEVNGDDGGG